MDQPISHTTLRRRHRTRIAAAILALTGVCAAAWGINRAVRPSIDASDIMVSEVRKGDVSNTVNASGVVIPVHEEVVSSPVNSRVAKVHAKPGQHVAAGQLLLELDDRDIRLALDSLKEQVAQQDNRVVTLTQELEKNRKEIASAIELLAIDLKAAQAKHERYLKLRQSGAVSGEDMLTAELNVTRAEIQLRQKRELIEDTRRVTLSAIEAARLQKSIYQKQLAQQERMLDQAHVKAPFAGVLTSLAEQEGASVSAGQQVARVSELNNFRIEATLSDFHARALSPGQQVRVEHNGEVLAGTVHTILPEIQNGAVKLYVSLAQPNNKLLRNKMRVDVNIVTDHRANTLVIDSGPAFNGRGRQPAWKVEDGVATKTWLQIGSGDGKRVEVVSGARPGERFIVSDTASFNELDSIRISD